MESELFIVIFVPGHHTHGFVKDRAALAPGAGDAKIGPLFRVWFSCHSAAHMSVHACCSLASLYMACYWSV